MQIVDQYQSGCFVQLEVCDVSLDPILGFKGEYEFLNNFWPSDITLSGHRFTTVEHGFHFFKTEVPEERKAIRMAKNASEAKALGRACSMRPDWEQIKEKVMRELLYQKFAKNNRLRAKLLETGQAYLEETNNWNDKYWGVCNGEGKNRLGWSLMTLRAFLLTFDSGEIL